MIQFVCNQGCTDFDGQSLSKGLNNRVLRITLSRAYPCYVFSICLLGDQLPCQEHIPGLIQRSTHVGRMGLRGAGEGRASANLVSTKGLDLDFADHITCR